MDGYAAKHSYTVTCSSSFRDAVNELAARRKVNVADLARSVLLVLPPDVIAAYPDPGEPDREDRDKVVLKSGPSQGRLWRRKPRLQVRLPFGASVPVIRRALALALAVEGGDRGISLFDPSSGPSSGAEESGDEASASRMDGEEIEKLREENERLRTLLSVMAFEPLSGGIKTREDALYVLGFPPNVTPDIAAIKARFRLHATIHHPDSDFGNHQRMSQLNSAMALLTHGGGRRVR